MRPATPLTRETQTRRDGVPVYTIRDTEGHMYLHVPNTVAYDAPRHLDVLVHAANLYPELVEALDRIMHYANMGASVCDVDTYEQPEFVAARAVLAKAKGE